MPLLPSHYSPPWWLRDGHTATLLSALAPAPRIPWNDHSRLELPDGDFLDLYGRIGHRQQVAILCHGLEGSVESGYIRRMAAALDPGQWDVLAWNYRGCGGVTNRLASSYHSGSTGDLHAVVQHAVQRWPSLVLVGFSLGGNLVMHYAASGHHGMPTQIHAAAAVSAPVDLASSAAALDGRPGNRWYLRRFLSTLLRKTREKRERFPESFPPAAQLQQIRTIREFDHWVTAPLHGFSSALEYWEKCSSLPFLAQLRIPALLLNAANDPLLDRPSFPEGLARNHPWLDLEVPTWGGHVGFADPSQRSGTWYAERIVQFLTESLPARGSSAAGLTA